MTGIKSANLPYPLRQGCRPPRQASLAGIIKKDSLSIRIPVRNPSQSGIKAKKVRNARHPPY